MASAVFLPFRKSRFGFAVGSETSTNSIECNRSKTIQAIQFEPKLGAACFPRRLASSVPIHAATDDVAPTRHANLFKINNLLLSLHGSRFSWITKILKNPESGVSIMPSSTPEHSKSVVEPISSFWFTAMACCRHFVLRQQWLGLWFISFPTCMSVTYYYITSLQFTKLLFKKGVGRRRAHSIPPLLLFTPTNTFVHFLHLYCIIEEKH